ncbi:MAG: hypothetical protein QM744_14415 [Mesorhizobium sp.]
MMHTKEFLAQELERAGSTEIAAKARDGYYHDFLSPLTFPEIQLEQDLSAAGTPQAEALRQRHLGGVFDASKEESDEWWEGEEGREAAIQLLADKQTKKRNPTSIAPKAGFDWNGIKWAPGDQPPPGDCSYCGAAIAEDSVPLILWKEDGAGCRFCDRCTAKLWAAHNWNWR